MAMADWDFLSQPFENDGLGTIRGDDSLAAWLLSPPGSHGWDLDVSQQAFMNYNADYGTCNTLNPSNSAFLTSSNQPDDSISATWVDQGGNTTSVHQEHHTHVSTRRYTETLFLLQTFHSKHASSLKLTALGSQNLLYKTPEGTWPNVTTFVFEQCIASFWENVASQMPILHKPTFSANHCPVLLLLAIIPLGAAQLVRLDSVEKVLGYRDLADLIVMGLRWEIQSNENAQPPVNLWVAQALLLLEFYEKMYSSRQLHERAHIHHVSTLTLLRRGSPLGGRLGTERPLEALEETQEAEDLPDAPEESIRLAFTSDRWWHQWANNEAMLRVVFAAYEMDTLHAAMFGHESSLLPSDVGLPLPCDDTLWTAETPDSLYALETSFHLCGIKTTKFLDGLKSCLHGNNVQLHYRARMTLAIGLLSVACHLRPREKHIKLFETVPSQTERKKWTQMMFRALDVWKEGLDEVMESLELNRHGRVASSMAVEPTVLFHLTYITTHIDILYCQILAGTRLLLGRRVSRKELASAKSYAATWATTSEARLAVLHSAKLLAETLSPQRPTMGSDPSELFSTVKFSFRSDPCIHRPWSLYLAALTIWTYHYTISQSASNHEVTASLPERDVERQACSYVVSLVEIDDMDQLVGKISNRGCSAMLQYVSDNLATTEPEILIEASARLRNCRKLLNTPAALHHSRMEPSSP